MRPFKAYVRLPTQQKDDIRIAFEVQLNQFLLAYGACQLFFAVMIRTIQTQTSLHIDQHIIRFLGNMIAFFAISTCVRACARVLKLRCSNMCVAMCLLLLIHFIV